jgi:predicted transposase/invertase (TIGR01784 family)
MVLGKFLNPRNDLAFKRIFGSEKNKDILIHFLNDILMRSSPITEVSFLKTVQDPEVAPLRVTIVDVMCQDQDKNRFIIEMQLSREKAFDRRALYYAARAYCSQRSDRVKFEDLKNVYFLAITNFTPFPDKKAWLSRIGLKDLDTNEHDIKAIQLFFMQLPFFDKTKKDIGTMTIREKWAYFFKYANETTEEDLAKIVGDDLVIKRAYDELNRFSWSEFQLNDYESVEMKHAADKAVLEAAFETGQEKGHKQGLEEGRKEGIEEGEKKKSLEIAKALLKEKLSVKQVSQLTGLTEKDLSGFRE